jgi:lipopolysaccharide heptosyltransferase I
LLAADRPKDLSNTMSPTTADRKSPRILIVRLSAIGDVIHGMPVACALRERFPDSLLVWVVEQRSADVIQDHEALDQRIVLPRGWLKSPLTVWRLRRQLRALHFDTAIDAQGLSKSAIVAWLSGAKRRIGLHGVWGRELSTWLNNELVEADGLHAVDRSLRLLRPLGIDSPQVEFQVPAPAAEQQAAEAMIRSGGLTGGFVLVTSGAGWPSKLWPIDRYAAVAVHLGRQWKLPCVLIWGNAEERARAEQIVAAAEGHARLAPKMTLLELASLARRATFCLGSDTGPLHLAAAVGTPCIGLYGPWPADKHGPYGPQHLTVQKMCLDGTTRQRRHAPPTCMEAIDVESVCEACDEMAQRRGLEPD